MDDSLVCVDSDDTELYPLSKAECHLGDGVLHRAFSVFLLDPSGTRVLLQQRASLKLLWPGFWSNSCCSHPRWLEPLASAVERRLAEELGVSATVRPLYSFIYHAQFEDIGAERELCHVFLGTLRSSQVHPDPKEISAVRWASRSEIDQEVADHPEVFTPWFLQEWAEVRTVL